MFDISKYPLLNILIPILSGMIGISFCFNVIKFDKWIAISIILIYGIISTLTYILSYKNKIRHVYSTFSFYILFACVGSVMCGVSVNSAKEKYGVKWRVSVYRENPFQIKSAKSVQQSILHFYHSHGLKGDNGAIIEAITTGSREHLTKSIKSDFSRAGTAHILALSGFHIGIIYILLQFVFLQRIVTLQWRWISNILLLICLWTYAFISGMSPSIVRSVLMCTILMIGTLHTDQLISINGLALSALITLCINPMLIFHVGFQLSYISMLGIYIIGLPLCRLYDSYTFLDSFLWCTICITISCTVFTLPIVSHVFGRIAVLSIFSNIIATILTYILFLLFFIWIITSAAAPVTTLLLGISSLLIRTTSYISSITFSNIDVRFPTTGVVFYYCVLSITLILIYDFWERDKKFSKIK